MDIFLGTYIVFLKKLLKDNYIIILKMCGISTLLYDFKSTNRTTIVNCRFSFTIENVTNSILTRAMPPQP